jgi:O-antigen/teichoic acid export membrane protein
MTTGGYIAVGIWGFLLYAGGLLFWPVFCLFRRGSDQHGRRLRKIFFLTLGSLVGLGALLGIVALLGRFNHNWLPLTLLFPIINLSSIISSIVTLFRKYDDAA